MKPKPDYIISFSLLLFLCNSPIAQTQNSRFNFKHLTVQTGLAQNIVYHFLQDSRGYIWLGTRNGLTRYDGTHTVNFLNDEQTGKSIRSNFITRIIEDPLHQVWIGTDAGISRYNPKENNFSNFNLSVNKGQTETAFCVPLGFGNDHEMWLLETNSKCLKVFNTQTQQIDSLTATPAVDGMMRYDSISRLRHIWTYLSSGTIHYIFKNKALVKKERFFSGEPDNRKEPVFQVLHVLPYDSTVWLSTTAGLIELNTDNHSYHIYNKWEEKTVNEFRYAAMAPSGMLWAATGNNGIYTFNLKTKTFTDNYRNYRLDPFSIGSNNIVSLYFDRVGNIWCGSYGQGISYTNTEKNNFQKALPRNDFEKWAGNNNVKWIGYDYTGNLWCIINDDAGLWKLSKGRHLPEYRQPVLENGKKFAGRFYKLLFDGDRYAWTAGKEGLFRYDLLTNHLRKIRYPFFSNDLFGSNWVQDIIKLNDGSFLFCTFKGLYHITSKNDDYIIEPYSELNKKAFTSFAALFQDEAGNIYVKDMGNGFYVLDISKGGYANPVIHDISFVPQIAQFCIDTPKNSILLATNFGLYRLNRKDYSLQKINFKTPPPFSSISSLVKAGNKLWLFGEKGLYCFDEQKNTGRIYTTEDGLPANEFNISAINFSSDTCIAGTTNGLVSFSPKQLQDKLYPPVVQLTAMYVNDSSSGFIPNPQEMDKISLAHNQNTFSFDFAPIAFQNADGCSFEYQLQAYDKSWIKSGIVRYTRYSKIPPGSYTFQLRAIDANGTVSPYHKTLEIEIAKAFWQTTLFKIVVAAIVLFAVWLMIKWYLNGKIRKQMRRFEKQQAIEKERTRIATDMHDDLGSGLSTIKFLSEKVKRNSYNDATKNDADKIALSSNELVQKMNEIIWAMNEKNDSLADLLFYTRSYAVTWCEENNLRCEALLPETIPDTFISGDIRRNVFLTVKESLHNVVKHAQAKKVVLVFNIDKNLNVSVKDDGVGFTDNGRVNGNGLANMKNRIASIGGDFTVTNSNGISILFSLPLHVT